jgi:ribonuclease P protein component
VLRQGARSDGPLFLLVATPNKSGFDRLGLVASRKLGTAAQRNRAKRLLREVFRRNKRKVKTGLDLVLIGKPGIAGGCLGDVEREYRERLARLATRKRHGHRRPRPPRAD